MKKFLKSNRFFYFAAFILSLIFVYFFGGRIAYAFFYAVLFLPVISFVYLLALRIFFRYSIDIDRKFIMKGDVIKLIVTLNNKSILFYPLVKMTFCGLNPSTSGQCQTQSFSLPSFSQNAVYFETECKYRGLHSIGISSVIFVDFLGIMKLTRKKNLRMPIAVYPKVVFLDHVSNMSVISPQSLLSSNQYDTDMVMIADMRKYVFGDSLKKIHWKLTAKSNELIVKNFEKTLDTETVILLDLEQPDCPAEKRLQIEDKVIEATAALAHLSLSSMIPVHLTYCDGEIKTVEARDLNGFQRIHGVLAEVEFNGRFDIGFILDEYVKGRKQSRNILIVTSGINEALCQKLHQFKASGFNLALVLVSENLSGEERPGEEKMLSTLGYKGIRTYVVNEGEEVKTAFERQAG